LLFFFFLISNVTSAFLGLLVYLIIKFQQYKMNLPIKQKFENTINIKHSIIHGD